MSSRMADPPILVGGGGSTLIWVHKKISLREIDAKDVNKNAPKPEFPDDYRVFECGVDITASTVRANDSCGCSKHTGLERTHSTRFDGEVPVAG